MFLNWKNQNCENDSTAQSNLQIITLNVNRLNTPAKKHRLAEWIQKQDL